MSDWKKDYWSTDNEKLSEATDWKKNYWSADPKSEKKNLQTQTPPTVTPEFLKSQQDKLLGINVLKTAVQQVPANVQKSLGGITQSFEEIPNPLFEKAIQEYNLQPVNPQFQNIGQNMVQDATRQIDLIKKQNQIEPGSAGEFIANTAGSIIETGPALAAAALTKNPMPLIAQTGLTSFGQTYAGNREFGASPQESLISAAGAGVLDTGLNVVPFGQLVKPGATLGKKLLSQVVEQGLSNALAETGKAGIDKLTVDPNMTWNEAGQRIGTGTATGAAMGGAMSLGVEPFMKRPMVEKKVLQNVQPETPTIPLKPAENPMGDVQGNVRPETDHPLDRGGILNQSANNQGMKKNRIEPSYSEPDAVVSPNNMYPPHGVRDKVKLEELAESMKENGWQGRPILVFDDGGANRAFTGSHRIAAAKKSGIDVPVIKIDEAKFEKWWSEDNYRGTLEQFMREDEAQQVRMLKEMGDDRAANELQLEIDINEFDESNVTPDSSGAKKKSAQITPANKPGLSFRQQETSAQKLASSLFTEPKIKKVGFQDKAEAFLGFDAKEKGFDQFKKENPEVSKEAYDDLVTKIDKIPEQERGKLKLDLQMFAEKNQEAIKKAKDTLVSTFRTNTIERATEFSDELRDEVLPEKDFQYEKETALEWQTNAERNIEVDRDMVMRNIEESTSISGGTQAHEAAVIAKQLKDEYLKTGKVSDFKRWMGIVAQKTRETARGLKGTDTAWEKVRSTEGAVLKAQKTVDEVQEVIQDKNIIKRERIKSQAKKVKDGLEQARKEAARMTAEEMLANRVSKAFGEAKAPKRDPVTEMVNELFKVAKESPLVKGKGTPISPIEFLKQAIQEREKYADVWEKAKVIVQEKFKDDENALKLLGDYFKNPAKPEYSQATLQRSIDASMKDLELKLAELAKQFTDDRNASIAKVKELLVVKTGAVGNDADVLAEQVYNKMKKNIEEKTHQILRSMFKEIPQSQKTDVVKSIDDLAAMGAFDNVYYRVFANRKLPAKVRILLKENNINLGEVVKKSISDLNFSRSKFLKNLSERMSIQNDDALLILNETEQIFNNLVESKRKKTLETMFKTREGAKQKTLFDKVMELVNLGAYDDAAIVDLIKEKEGLPVLTSQDVKTIVDTMETAKTYLDGSVEKRIALGKVQKLISDKIPADFRDKFRGLQRISLLTNPKTLVTRNPGSNVLWSGISALEENTFGAAVDKITSLVRGSERTTVSDLIGKSKAYKEGMKKGLREWGQDLGGGWANYKKLPADATLKQRIEAYKKDRLNSVDTSPSRGQMELPAGKTFKNKTLNAIDDFVKNSLQLGDRPFYQGAYESRIYELKKIRNKTAVDEAMETEARMYALDKVFQNNSELAKRAGNIRRQLGIFGDIVMPFTQTPANVMDKLLDHTPVGLGKAIFQGFKAKKTGEFDQKYFTDTLSRFLAGSGLAVLGYAMASKGLITGKKEKSSKAEDTEQALGVSNYALKFGDSYYTYDWTQPIGGLLAAGADSFYGGKNKKDFGESISAGMISAGDTLFNQSFLQGMLKLLSGYSPTTNIIKTAVEAPTQFAPTAGKQMAQLFDPYVRDTASDNPLEQAKNKVVSKIPFASKTLPKRVDVFGRDVKAYQGRNNLFNVALNPGFYTEIEKSPGGKLALDLYNKTGETDQLPRKAPTSVTYRDQRITLTVTERNRLQKLMGLLVIERFNALPDSKMFNSFTDEQKVKYMKKIVSDTVDKAKSILIEEMKKAKRIKK
jgi:hypothetical protein